LALDHADPPDVHDDLGALEIIGEDRADAVDVRLQDVMKAT